MMLDDIIVNITPKYTKVLGLSVQIKLDQNYMYHGAVLERKKKSIQLIKSFHNCESIDSVKEQIEIDIPVSLNINGKGLLHKKINVSQQKSLLQQIIPNGDHDDFYIQTEEIDENITYTSVCRKKNVDSIVEVLEEKGFKLLSVSLGPYAFSSVKRLVKPAPIYQLMDYQITYSGDQLEAINVSKHSDDKEYQLEEEKLNHKKIVPFAEAFQYLVGIQKEIKAEYLQKASLKSTYHRFFKLYGLSTLLLLFAIAIINVIVFSIYNVNTQRWDAQLSQNQGQANQLNQLQQEVKEKSSFLQELGWVHHSKASYYADQIAQNVPSTILLQQFWLNPKQKQKLGDKKLRFTQNHIDITGTSSHITRFNDWIKELKKFEWVAQVDIISYHQERAKGTSDFVIEVTMK